MSDTPLKDAPAGQPPNGPASAAHPTETPASITVPASERHEHTSVWAQIKQHKIARWTLAYVAFGFAFLHGVTLLSDALEWPHIVVRSVTLLLIVRGPGRADARLVSRRASLEACQRLGADHHRVTVTDRRQLAVACPSPDRGTRQD